MKNDNEKNRKRFEQYIEYCKKSFNYTRDLYPEDVQEAYDILFQVGEIYADPTIPDNITIGEALYSKISREKISWAGEIIKNAKTKKEIEAEKRAKRRAKEKKRRIRNGKMKPREIKKDKSQEIYENFDTHTILEAVDALDEIRGILADRDGEEGYLSRPPELRDTLLKLHGIAMDVVNYETTDDHGVFDMAFEIEDELYYVSERLEKLQKVISKLTDLAPEEELDEN